MAEDKSIDAPRPNEVKEGNTGQRAGGDKAAPKTEDKSIRGPKEQDR